MSKPVRLNVELIVDREQFLSELVPAIVAELHKLGIKPATQTPGPVPIPARPGMAGAARPAPREPGEDDIEPEHMEPPATAPAASFTGRQFLGWIKDQPDSPAVLKRATALGKSLGFGSMVVAWTPSQVAEIHAELTSGKRLPTAATPPEPGEATPVDPARRNPGVRRMQPGIQDPLEEEQPPTGGPGKAPVGGHPHGLGEAPGLRLGAPRRLLPEVQGEPGRPDCDHDRPERPEIVNAGFGEIVLLV